MVHQLRALVSLVEDLGSVLRTHVLAHNFLELQVLGIKYSLLASTGKRWYTYIYLGKHSYVKKNVKI